MGLRAAGHLLSKLSKDLGPRQARHELRWMQESLLLNDAQERSLEQMITRRLAGEPLQYILGAYSLNFDKPLHRNSCIKNLQVNNHLAPWNFSYANQF